MSRFDVSDALGDAFRTVFRNLPTYFRTQGVPILIAGVIGLAYNLMVTASLEDVLQQAIEQEDFGPLIMQLPAILGGGLVAGLSAWLLGVLATGIGIVATHRLLHSEDITLSEAFERVKPRFWNLLLTSLLITLALVGVILAGMLLFILIIPVIAGIAVAIYLAVRWATALPVSVLEEREVTENLRRARDMTAGSRGAIFGAFLLLILATVAATAILSIPVTVASMAIMPDPATATADGSFAMPVGIQVASWAINLVVQLFSSFLFTALMVIVYRHLSQPVAQAEPQMGAIGGDEHGFGTSPPPGF